MMLYAARHGFGYPAPKDVWLTPEGDTDTPANICRKCGKAIPVQWEPQEGWEGDGRVVNAPDNGLDLAFEGAYGWFTDNITHRDHVRLCHECAHELCDWLGINPNNWHSHNPDTGQHADHWETQYVVCDLCGIEKDATKECGYPCA